VPNLRTPLKIASLVSLLLLSACDKSEAKPTKAALVETPLAPATEPGSTASAAQTFDEDCPGAADGSELVGTLAKEWQLEEWIHSEPLTLRELRGRVVLVRFWTSPGCPFCEKTMPALQQLSEEFRGEPVTFIGAFHSKPRGAYPDMSEPSAVAKGWGVTFPIAMDRDWKTQNSWWLDDAHRHATSETFVIGKDGKIVHVHPGPVFHPSDDPAKAAENRDFLAVREAIRVALAD
jgi:thiol-disulfide isomerase/thioredoxin